MTEGTNGNGVKITTREVWDISKRLERLETKVDDIIVSIYQIVYGAIVTAIVTIILYVLSSGKIN
jgi:tetrahydromethanopterin S-methyltransferase subunit G